MDASLKKILRALSLELRHILEGEYDHAGKWHPGDLESRLNEIGVWRDRAKPLDELAHLSAEDKAARKVVDAYLKLRKDAGVERQEAVAEFVRESAYTWANRLFALRCMEARNIIDEVILQKDAYGGRSLVHNRFAKKKPAACSGEDDGLFPVLFEEFVELSKELPGLFNPKAPAVALRPSVAALKKCVALLSGRENVKGQDTASDAVFEAHDAFGWAYQYWNSETKDRVFEKVRNERGAKIEGADIIPATQLYTEPYMVKFLVQNSLGALWMGIRPESKLFEKWEYYVRDVDRAAVEKKPVREISMLDPAIGSGHFHLESFDLFYAMSESEGILKTPEAIAASILNNNLFGIDIDERAIQIATAALWMKAKAKAPKLQPSDLTTFHDHIVATNIRLPKGKDHLEAFLKKHPDDAPLRSALVTVFDGLENAHEIGSLLQIEEPVEKALRDQLAMTPKILKGGALVSADKVDFQEWKREVISRLKEHFHAEAQAGDLATAFFGLTAGKGLAMLDVLARRYDVVAANPPYMGAGSMGRTLKQYTQDNYEAGKRDLYAAFILRCIQLAGRGGRISMVTRQSWMFLRYFKSLRAKRDDEGNFCGGVLHTTSVELVAQLGPGAFGEISGEVVTVVMFVLANRSPSISHTLTGARILSYPDPSAKAQALRSWASHSTSVATYRPEQRRFLSLPESPLIFWLTEGFWQLFGESEKLQDHADALEGVQTGNNLRWLRFFWETPCRLNDKEWAFYVKGGGYQRWAGLDDASVRWSESGNLIADAPGATLRNRERYFTLGLSYTDFASGCLGVRLLKGDEVFDLGAPAIFLRPYSPWTLEKLACILNCRISSVLIRFLSPNPQHIRTGYLRLIPLPTKIPNSDADRAVRFCVEQAVQWESKFNVMSRHYEPNLLGCHTTILADELKLALGDTLCEKAAFESFDLTEDDVSVVVAQTGKPLFMLPVVDGCSEVPKSLLTSHGSGQCIVPSQLSLSSLQLDEEAFLQLKKALRSTFECNATVTNKHEDEASDSSDDQEDDEEGYEETPIPPQTSLEALAFQLSIHPISIYWLLKEGIEKEGWRCIPEEQRLTADRFTVIILRLLGHRWPKLIEANEPVPAWADNDGVIPVTEGTNEKTLLERARQRIAADFPGGNVQAIENEFQEIMGETLEKWLPGSFFSRHISQFKKRPIAWQIETTPIRNHDDKARKKAARANAGPVFSCLVYYHKLDADLLPKIRTQYVGELITKYQTEERTLEKLALKTDEQDTRKWQLQNWIDELKAFDDQLNQISSGGFATGDLRQYAIEDAMLQLKSRWLEKLRDACQPKPLKSWQELAKHEKIHKDLADWIADAITRLPRHCSAVGPQPPDEKKLKDDPTSAELAAIICVKPHKLVREALTLVCEDWWKKFDEIVLAPIKQQIKEARERLAALEAELEQTDPPLTNARKLEIATELKPLKPRIKSLRENMEGLTESADKVRKQIIAWKCDDAEDWEKWLAKQPLYDQISALNGQKSVPNTVADWTAQESLYSPDINDGVRVNVAPLQKSGLIAADVLTGKDLDKAIADRAEWRADERRWVREGKLPQPGWW